AGLGDVHPAVRVDLEASRVPTGVGMGRAVHVAELDLRSGPVGVDVQREGRLEDLLLLVPVDLGPHVDPRAAHAYADHLADPGRAERPLDLDRALGTFAHHGDRVDVGEVGVPAPVV